GQSRASSDSRDGRTRQGVGLRFRCRGRRNPKTIAGTSRTGTETVSQRPGGSVRTVPGRVGRPTVGGRRPGTGGTAYGLASAGTRASASSACVIEIRGKKWAGIFKFFSKNRGTVWGVGTTVQVLPRDPERAEEWGHSLRERTTLRPASPSGRRRGRDRRVERPAAGAPRGRAR